MIKPYDRITKLNSEINTARTYMITRQRKTEQTGHVLKTEIVAGLYLPVAEATTEYSIE